jgi:hypothetical protein
LVASEINPNRKLRLQRKPIGQAMIGKSKSLKNYTEIFVSRFSICESTIPKAIVIVQIYEKLHGNCREDNSVRETVKMIDNQSDVYRHVNLSVFAVVCLSVIRMKG